MQVTIAPIETSIASFLKAKDYSAILVLVDQNTKKHCYPLIKGVLPKHKLIKIKSGEEHKTLSTCTHIWEVMTAAQLDRHALIINLGGGVIGDMGGFCAATYKRGIDFIQIPTTLLAQVDASVGGKLGIDFNGFKNHIGSFKVPNAVLIDPVFLKTLPKNELRSGHAEIIKHCLIKDKSMWNDLRKTEFENLDFAQLIEHSVAIKKQIVTADPEEKGERKTLNFGHTIGHAIETFYLSKKRLLHGEAIAIGMIAEAYVGFTRKMISEEELLEIEEYIYALYGKVKIKDKYLNDIVKLAKQDKKNKNGKIRASLLNNIGQCMFDINISTTEIKKAIQYYLK